MNSSKYISKHRFRRSRSRSRSRSYSPEWGEASNDHYYEQNYSKVNNYNVDFTADSWGEEAQQQEKTSTWGDVDVFSDKSWKIRKEYEIKRNKREIEEKNKELQRKMQKERDKLKYLNSFEIRKVEIPSEKVDKQKPRRIEDSRNHFFKEASRTQDSTTDRISVPLSKSAKTKNLPVKLFPTNTLQNISQFQSFSDQTKITKKKNTQLNLRYNFNQQTSSFVLPSDIIRALHFNNDRWRSSVINESRGGMERHSFLGAVPQLLSSIPHSSPPKISKELFEKFTVKTLEYPPSSEFSARPVLCQYNRNPFCEVPEDVLHLLPPAAQGTRKMCRIVVRDDECRSFSLLGETLLGEYTDMEDLEAFAEEGVVIEIEVMDVPSEEIDKAKRWLKEKERRDSKKAAEYINRTTNGKLKFSYFGDNSEDNTINMEKEDEEEKEEGELTSSFEDANVKNSETSSSDMPSVQDAPTFPLMQDSHKDEQDANHMHSEVEEADAWSDSYNTEDSELNTQLQSVFLKPTMPSLDSPRKDSHLLIHPPTRMEIESNQMTNSFGGITSNIGPLSTERTFNPSFTDSYQPKQNNSINQPQRDSSEAPSFLALPSSTDNLGTETCQRHSEHHIPYVKFTTQSVPLYQQMHSSFDRRSTGISHHLQDSYEQFDQRNTNSTQQQLNSASTSATNDSLFTNSHSLLTSTSSPSDFTGISNNSKKDAFSTKPFASFSSSFSNEIYQPPQIQEGSTADCKYCKRKVFVNQLASHENGCRNKMLYQNELGTSVQPSQSHREDSLENEERTIFSASSKQPLFDSDQLLTETLSTHPFANIMDDSHTQTDIQTPSTLHSTNQSSQILKFSQNDIYKDSISIPPFFIETVKSNAEQHKSIPAHFTPHSHLLQVSTLHPSITHVFAMPHPMPREISADTVEMEKEILDKWSKTILLATFGTDLVLRTCVLSPDDWESPDKTNSDTEFSSALRSSSDEADAFFVPQHIPVVPKEIAASFSFIPESSVFKNNSEGYDTPENMFGSLYSISKLSAHKQEQTIASYFDLCTSVNNDAIVGCCFGRIFFYATKLRKVFVDPNFSDAHCIFPHFEPNIIPFIQQHTQRLLISRCFRIDVVVRKNDTLSIKKRKHNASDDPIYKAATFGTKSNTNEKAQSYSEEVQFDPTIARPSFQSNEFECSEGFFVPKENNLPSPSSSESNIQLYYPQTTLIPCKEGKLMFINTNDGDIFVIAIDQKWTIKCKLHPSLLNMCMRTVVNGEKNLFICYNLHEIFFYSLVVEPSFKIDLLGSLNTESLSLHVSSASSSILSSHSNLNITFSCLSFNGEFLFVSLSNNLIAIIDSKTMQLKKTLNFEEFVVGEHSENHLNSYSITSMSPHPFIPNSLFIGTRFGLLTQMSF